MKKVIVLILFTCFTLFTLTGCKYNVSTKKLATTAKVEKFFSQKDMDFLTKGDFSYSYEINYEEDLKNGIVEESSKLKVKGRAISDSKSGDYKEYYKGTKKVEGTTISESGITKYSRKVKEETTVINQKSYISLNAKEKYGDITTKTSYNTRNAEKSYLSQDVVEILSQMFSLLSAGYTGAKVYIDGDNCKIVVSTLESHTEFFYIFDGSHLTAMKYTQKTADSELEVVIEFEDVKAISRPKGTFKNS